VLGDSSQFIVLAFVTVLAVGKHYSVFPSPWSALILRVVLASDSFLFSSPIPFIVMLVYPVLYFPKSSYAHV
jgi:hypothetical protein